MTARTSGRGRPRRLLASGWRRRGDKGTGMKPLAAAVASLVLLGPVLARADRAAPPGPGASAGDGASGVAITRAGSQPSARGPEAYFTGSVRVDAPFQAGAPARVSGGIVTFEPGARSAWHTHPLGQTLIVTAGVGWVQQWGGPVQEIRPGDVVWIPPGVKHWHGATATAGMTHVAVSERLDGKSVDWMEKVGDAQYRADRRTLPPGHTDRPRD